MAAKPFNTTNPRAMEWTEKAFALLEAGKLEAEATVKDGITVVSAYGTCPYCDDHLRFSDTLNAVTEGGGGVDELERRGDEPVYQEFTVTCGCDQSHEGDPKKATGCGTSFRVRVLVS